MNWKDITFSPLLPPWVIAALFALGLAALVLLYPGLRKKVGGSRSLGLCALRLGALALLIGCFLDPAMTERKEKRSPPPVGLIIDTSATMALPGKGGKSRLEEVKVLLLEGERPLLKSLAERLEVQVYSLGESLRPLEAGEIAGLKASPGGSDLAAALEKLFSGKMLPVLFSDGRVRGEGRGPSGPPLFTVPAGDPGEYRDLWVQAVRAPAVAFRGREVRVEAVVKSRGFRPMTLPVSLREGQKLLAAQTVQVPGDPAEIPVSFSFTPEETGLRHLSFSIPPRAGEATVLNNSFSFSVRVARDKIRVLTVSGHPSLNYRHLRTALKNDPSIDLLSFVILRTPTDVLNVSLQEQSLIPFPVETLFSRELQNFDLLVFDDFPFHVYVRSHHLERVREFVKGGGGLALIGGPNLLDGGRYAGTPLEEVLPVEAAAKGEYRREIPWKVRLTRAGAGHPVTRLEAGEKENGILWGEMPPLDGINRLQPKASAAVLLEGGEGVSHPVLSVGEFGRGRVLVLATDYAWKWHMGMVALGRAPWAYNRFLERSVRWLTRDPALDPVQILLPEGGIGRGQKGEIRVRVRPEGESPRWAGRVQISLIDPQGGRVSADFRPRGEAGEYAASFLPEKGGIYRVKVETPGASTEETLNVSDPVAERDGFPDHERLRRLARSTGGKFLASREEILEEILSAAQERKTLWVEEKRTPLGAHWAFPALVLLLLSAEWYFRRRWGLV